MAPAAGQASEEFMAWQHLANAGLIEGSYSGVSGTGSDIHTIIGTNVPRAKLSNGGWSFIWTGTVTNPADPAWLVGNSRLVRRTA